MKHITPPSAPFAFVLLFLLTALSIEAAPRSVEQARAAAKALLQRVAARHAPGHATATEPRLVYTCQRTATRAQDAAAYYYVFSQGEDAGYSVVSGDDRLPAIVGYTEDGDYATAALPDGLAAVLQQYRDFLDNATDSEIAEAQALRRASAHATIAPLVTTKWNQNSPYNDMCPKLSTGKRAATGCVATAMAQVLKYWEHPAQLLATTDRYKKTSNKIQIESIPAGETYDWANMLPKYEKDAYTDEQGAAVAKLMFHVGCAVHMSYGSSSAASATPEHFIKYFGMDTQTTREVKRSQYLLAEWDALIYSELAAPRPVFYTGGSTGGRHAFILDGYRDGLYHVNWGWGGTSDGYFDISILNPKNNTSIGSSPTSDGYSGQNDAIIGLIPDNGQDDAVMWPTLICRLLGNDQISDLTFDNGTITAKATSIKVKNPTMKTVHCCISLGYMADDGTIVNVCGEPKFSNYAPPTSTSSSGKVTSLSRSISFAAEEGKTYTLFMIESADGQTWQRCLTETGQQEVDTVTKEKFAPQTYITIKVENGTATLAPYSYATLSATAAFADDGQHHPGVKTSVDVTVTNSGDGEYYGKVMVYVSPKETKPAKAQFTVTYTAAAHSDATFNFAFTPDTICQHHVWICDANNKEIGTATLDIAAYDEPWLIFKSIKCTNASDETIYKKYSTYSGDSEFQVVNDTKAEIAFTVANYGPDYEGEYKINRYDPATKKWGVTRQTLAFPSGTTTYTFTAEGKAGELRGVWITNDTATTVTPIADLATPIKHAIKGSTYFTFKNRELVYLAGLPGGPDGITAPSVSPVDPTAPCYNLQGQRVTGAQRGIVIQDGRKVVRK